MAMVVIRKRKITVRPYKHPRLKFVVGFREAGKRKRSFFETRAQANAFAAFKNAELKRNGVEGAEFPTSLRIMAQNAIEQLKPFGKDIADAVKHYVDHLKASEKSCTVLDLVEELVAAKKADGASRRHVDDLRSRLGIFAEKFNGQMVARITSAEIDDWLRSLKVSAITRNHYRRLIVLAFNFAMKRGYVRYAPESEADKTEKAKEPKADIGILTVAQTARLLEAASPGLLPYIAIGTFAGLRRAELQRLDWSEIDFESGLIEVKAEKSKTAQRRLVKIQPNLREWILPVRKHRGKVAPEDFEKQFGAARTNAKITEWPDNALRHSFASYHLAHFRNAAETALELGHVNAAITFAHYRELVRPKDAERYWNIKPAAKEKIVQMHV
jgi:integrase